MRTIAYETVTESVVALCEETLFTLRKDAYLALCDASKGEDDAPRTYIELLLQNARLARKEKIPLSQDTGIPLFFVEQGLDVQIEGGTIQNAVEEGMKEVQGRYPFQTTLTHEPFTISSDSQIPAETFLQVTQCEGEGFKLSCLRIDGRSEQTCLHTHLSFPYDTQELLATVVEAVQTHGADANPPLLVGIGLGSTTSKVGQLAQKALLRPIGKPHQLLEYARLEQDILGAINELQLGPGGWGGKTTALTVHIEAAPSHRSLVPLCIYLQSPLCGIGERSL